MKDEDHGRSIVVELTPEEMEMGRRLAEARARAVDANPPQNAPDDSGCTHKDAQGEDCVQVGGGHWDCCLCGYRGCMHPGDETCEEAADRHALRFHSACGRWHSGDFPCQ